MTFRQRLDQRQVQKQILAPALQQAIKLLPLTNLELVEVINTELAQNPMIEIEGESLDRTAPEAGEPAEERDAEKPRDETPAELKLPAEDPSFEPREADGFDARFQEYLDDGFRPRFREDREAVSLENTLSRSPSLAEHLRWQATLTFADAGDLEVADFIIGNLDEDGFLSSPAEELAGLARTTPERVERVRETIKGFDPVGCGSRHVPEAWLAQMDSLGLKDEVARAIIADHLPLLEKSDYAQLSRVLNIPREEIREHIELIKHLDPRPGRKYNEEKTTYVVPDIIVTKEDDDWKITLNDDGMPRLRISPYYRQLMARASQGDPEARRFLEDRLKKALWFMRSLEQRDKTIKRVAQYIVEKQKGFFERGLDDIRPLTLMEIAQEIGVHESTVGRVVANKFMLTPQGMVPLKFFFHKSLPGGSGEDVSSLLIKEKIRKLVEGEDPSNPLSDIEIGDLLARENLKIARRTVAKYRMQLKIEPSHIRKRKSIMEDRA
ncbi:MAG TPA: RNA polymerase factor sigma-54 [Terriglobales bacterium]|nr:RNA polymerase factor sigma-54 [Terriglobales bacterium]